MWLHINWILRENDGILNRMEIYISSATFKKAWKYFIPVRYVLNCYQESLNLSQFTITNQVKEEVVTVSEKSLKAALPSNGAV